MLKQSESQQWETQPLKSRANGATTYVTAYVSPFSTGPANPLRVNPVARRPVVPLQSRRDSLHLAPFSAPFACFTASVTPAGAGEQGGLPLRRLRCLRCLRCGRPPKEAPEAFPRNIRRGSFTGLRCTRDLRGERIQSPPKSQI